MIVNNAGYGLAGAAEEVSDTQIKNQIDTNLIGSMQVIRAALPHLRKQGGGRVIQLASMGGQITFPALSIYHATKWAIEGFIESVAQEVGPFGIEFTIVEPGMARTIFGAGSMIAAEPMAVYDATPVGDFRRAAPRLAQALIDSVYANPRHAGSPWAATPTPRSERRSSIGSPRSTPSASSHFQPISKTSRPRFTSQRAARRANVSNRFANRTVLLGGLGAE